MISTDPDTSSNRFPFQIACCALFLILLGNLPGFLCMGIDLDTFAFDLYLRGIQEGKVLYKDMTENNLPGVIFIHWVTRELFGWSSIAIRSVDLLIVGSSIVLLASWTRGISITSRIWIVTFLLTFYFSMSEWNHCQRDPWMMLPLLGALFLRRKQIEKVSEGERSTLGVLEWANIEGFIWGCGFWLKPYIAVPAFLVWVVSLITCRRNGVSWKTISVDLMGLLVGAILCGSIGIAWMISSDCWQPYLDHLSRNGNDYVQANLYPYFAKWEPHYFQLVRLYPWSFLAVGPFLFSSIFLIRWCFARGERSESRVSNAFFSAAILGLFVEGVFLQHVFDYGIMPFLFFSLTWVLSRIGTTQIPKESFLLGSLCFVVAFVGHLPIFKSRLSCWMDCVREGPTPEVRDRLNIFHRVQYRDLERVKEFLIEQGIQDGELTVVHESGLPLFEALGIRPPTRTYMMTNQLVSFPSRRDEIGKDLSESKQRFMVTNTIFRKIEPGCYDKKPSRDPEPLPEYWTTPYDWTKHVVFRSGHYVVVEIPGNRMREWIKTCLGL